MFEDDNGGGGKLHHRGSRLGTVVEGDAKAAKKWRTDVKSQDGA